MRDIKFRYYDPSIKCMLSPSCVGEHGFYAEDRDFEDGRSMPFEKLMQFTGLKDKNAKMIYEGDIVSYYLPGEKPEDEKTQYTEAVSFIDGCFCVDGYTPVSVTADWEVEVIGNIYENASLLLPKPINPL